MAERFKDRVATQPNRYKIIPADGAEYYATLERADEPIEVGTPLNAENLNVFVDHMENTSNPHGVTIEQIGAAPSGYVTEVIDIASESELDAVLTNIIANMPDLTERHVVFQDNAGLFNGGFTLARIFTRVGTYATATFETYGYYGYTKWVKNCFSGSWYPLEWENPPMLFGKEYRTTERSNGSPVYAQQVYFGNLPNNTEKSYTFDGLTSANVVRYDLILSAYNDRCDSRLAYFVDSVIFNNTGSLYCAVKTNTNASLWVGYLTVYYTK